MRPLLGLAVIVAAGFLGACGGGAPPTAPATPAPDAASRASTAANGAPAQSSPASTVLEGPPPPAPRCRLTVTNTEGCQPNEVEVLVAPARSRIEHCHAGGAGKLNVRVRRAPGGKLAFDLAPGPSLDPTEKKCVLDALNSLSQNEPSTANTGGVSIPPTGFTSLLTIEW